MQTSNELMDFEGLLSAERPRLVGLCAWFSGSADAAEDLAQETLIAAWKGREQLISLDKLKPWTSSIARNICRNWSRRYSYEKTQQSFDAEGGTLEDTLADETTIELELDRHELATLLDQALALLPTDTAQMLVEHYIERSSHAEIAEKMSMNPGTVAVRLQRGKLSLQKFLRTSLKAEAAAFGLIEPAASQWEETNIWCPWCAHARLHGKFQKDKIFALRCPRCDPDAESLMAGLNLTQPYHARLLGNTKSYKPAYARLLSALTPLYQQAMQSQAAPCLACGKQLRVMVEHKKRIHHEHSPLFTQVILHCPACGWASNKSLTGFVIGSPEGQRFWREYPRMRVLPEQEIEHQGLPSFLTQLQSVTGNAELTVITRRDTFEILQVHTNVKL